MTDAEFRDAAAELGCTLDDTSVELLTRYEGLLRAWSDRVRLISRGDVDHIRARHLLDSIAILPHLPTGRLLDLGTGGGLPGVPIRILQPDRRLTLADSARMKCLFLKQIVEDLDLTGAEVYHGRVEAMSDTFDVVTARAVSELEKLWEWSCPLLAPGGNLVAFKGPQEEEQWRGAESWEGVSALQVNVVKSAALPRSRAIVQIRKGARG